MTNITFLDNHLTSTPPYSWPLLRPTADLYSALQLTSTPPYSWPLLHLTADLHSTLELTSTPPYSWPLLHPTADLYSTLQLTSTPPSIWPWGWRRPVCWVQRPRPSRTGAPGGSATGSACTSPASAGGRWQAEASCLWTGEDGGQVRSDQVRSGPKARHGHRSVWVITQFHIIISFYLVTTPIDPSNWTFRPQPPTFILLTELLPLLLSAPATARDTANHSISRHHAHQSHQTWF